MRAPRLPHNSPTNCGHWIGCLGCLTRDRLPSNSGEALVFVRDYVKVHGRCKPKYRYRGKRGGVPVYERMIGGPQ